MYVLAYDVDVLWLNVYKRIKLVFATRRYLLARYMLTLSVCPPVCPSLSMSVISRCSIKIYA